MAYIPTLKTKYNEEILPALMKEYGYKTVMQAPRLKKITLNQGLGKAVFLNFLSQQTQQIVLEVEHPHDETSEHRVEFYSSMGLYINPQDYRITFRYT